MIITHRPGSRHPRRPSQTAPPPAARRRGRCVGHTAATGTPACTAAAAAARRRRAMLGAAGFRRRRRSGEHPPASASAAPGCVLRLAGSSVRRLPRLLRDHRIAAANLAAHPSAGWVLHSLSEQAAPATVAMLYGHSTCGCCCCAGCDWPGNRYPRWLQARFLSFGNLACVQNGAVSTAVHFQGDAYACTATP